MAEPREPIHGWIVAMMGFAAAFGLLICWVSLPAAGAVLATFCAFLMFELGKIGARWYDERNKS